MKLEDFMTTGECATELGCTVGAVRKRIARGQMKTRVFGRQHLISIEEVKRHKANPVKRGRRKKERCE